MAKNKNEIVVKPKEATYSGHSLLFYPYEAKFIPSSTLQTEAVDIVVSEFPYNEVISTLKEKIQFHTSGQGFESVSCPKCGQVMEMDYWSELMSIAYESYFENMEMISLCCGEETAMNDLVYNDNSGFSQYFIEVVDAEFDKEKADRLKHRLETKLKTQLQIIWVSI